MNHLIIAAALAAQPSPVQSDDDYCRSIGETAELIMRKRQEEVPLSDMLAVFKGSEMESLWRGIALSAYEQPAFETREYQQREAASFRNHWETRCHQSKMEG